MDKNTNFYIAIENALIKPLIEEVNAIEPIEHEFSVLYRKNIKKIIKEQKKWDEFASLNGRPGSIKKKIKMIILIAAAMIALGGITVAACEPLREWIIGLFVEEYEDHIDVKTFSGSEADFEVPKLNELYQPTYIPEGYELQVNDLDASNLFMVWENNNGSYIAYSQDLLNTVPAINNEDVNIENILINGFDAILTYDDEYTTLTWSDGKYMYQINGITSKDEVVLMAESLMPKND